MNEPRAMSQLLVGFLVLNYSKGADSRQKKKKKRIFTVSIFSLSTNEELKKSPES